jgi:hypothetical protein
VRVLAQDGPLEGATLVDEVMSSKLVTAEQFGVHEAVERRQSRSTYWDSLVCPQRKE